MVALKGGEEFERKLREIAKNLKKAAKVRVGFLEGSTYPDGKPVAMIAAVQEFGATIDHPGGTAYYFLQKGPMKGMARFLPNSDPYADEFKRAGQVTGPHKIAIPPRPFFRTMIQEKSREWPKAIAGLLKDNDYDAAKTLEQAGAAIEGQLKESIIKFSDPANAPSTVAKKGFNDPLISSGFMLKSTGYEVKEGGSE